MMTDEELQKIQYACDHYGYGDNPFDAVAEVRKLMLIYSVPDQDDVKRAIIAAYDLELEDVARIEINVLMKGKADKITVNLGTSLPGEWFGKP